eukprot:4479483-Karenia_brevis.AAC.1
MPVLPRDEGLSGREKAKRQKLERQEKLSQRNKEDETSKAIRNSKEGAFVEIGGQSLQIVNHLPVL